MLTRAPPEMRAWARVWSWLRIHRLRLVVLFAFVLAPLLVFGLLAEDVLENESFFFDRAILLYLHGHSSADLDRLMLFFSRIGSGFWITLVDLLVLFYLAARRRRGDAFFWGLAVGGAASLNYAAKYSFARARPDFWLSIAPEKTFSFPSAHAMQTMALVTAVLVLVWPTKMRWPALVVGSAFVLLVGLSRVYLGVHYPSDVIAGWAASLAWVIGLSVVLYGYAAKIAPQAEPASLA